VLAIQVNLRVGSEKGSIGPYLKRARCLGFFFLETRKTEQETRKII
jgi:hypothetical protein